MNRKSPYGPVRVWDTESWIANSEDRVAAVIASMRPRARAARPACCTTCATTCKTSMSRLEGGTNEADRRGPGLGPGRGHRLHAALHRPADVPASCSSRTACPGSSSSTACRRRKIAEPGRRHAGRGRRPGRRLPARLLKFRTVLGLASAARGRAGPPAVGRPAGQRHAAAIARRWRNGSRRPKCSRDGSLTLADPEGLFMPLRFLRQPRCPQGRQDRRAAGRPGLLRCAATARRLVPQADRGRGAAQIAGYQPVEIKAKDFLARIEKRPGVCGCCSPTCSIGRSPARSAWRSRGCRSKGRTGVALLGNETKEVVFKVAGGTSAAQHLSAGGHASTPGPTARRAPRHAARERHRPQDDRASTAT